MFPVNKTYPRSQITVTGSHMISEAADLGTYTCFCDIQLKNNAVTEMTKLKDWHRKNNTKEEIILWGATI
jgi:hypothetical protein